MGPPSYMRFVVDRNVVMRRIELTQISFLISMSVSIVHQRSPPNIFWFLCLPNTSLSALSTFHISPPDAREKWYTYQIIYKHI